MCLVQATKTFKLANRRALPLDNAKIQSKFIQRSKIHGRNTRCSGELDLPICRLTKGQRSFAFLGAKLSNNLPNEIKQTSDVKKFKAKVCNYLLNLQFLVLAFYDIFM